MLDTTYIGMSKRPSLDVIFVKNCQWYKLSYLQIAYLANCIKPSHKDTAIVELPKHDQSRECASPRKNVLLLLYGSSVTQTVEEPAFVHVTGESTQSGMTPPHTLDTSSISVG